MVTASNPSGPPRPAMDLSAYQSVLIVKTDDVDGHPYRRGMRVTVDAHTFGRLRDKDMIADAKPAG